MDPPCGDPLEQHWRPDPLIGSMWTGALSCDLRVAVEVEVNEANLLHHWHMTAQLENDLEGSLCSLLRVICMSSIIMWLNLPMHLLSLMRP